MHLLNLFGLSRSKSRSWHAVTRFLLILLLFVNIAVLIWMNIYYNSQLSSVFREKTEKMMISWISSEEGRINALDYAIKEIATSQYNKKLFDEKNGSVDIVVRDEFLKTMEEKMYANPNIGWISIYDLNNQSLLRKVKSSYSNKLKRDLRDYVEKTIKENKHSSFPVGKYMVAEINGHLYYVFNLSIKNYVYSIASSIRLHDIVTEFNLDKNNVALGLRTAEGDIYFVNGSNDIYKSMRESIENSQSLGKDLILVQDQINFLNVEFLLASEDEAIASTLRIPAIPLLAISLLVISLILLLIVFLEKLISKPVKQMMKANKMLEMGDLSYRIQANAGSQEFELLYLSFNKMADEIKNAKIKSYDRVIEEQKKQLQLLRSQIRPHFYLNMITTISNMTYQNRKQDIRFFCQMLAKYMRYMLNSNNEWTTIGDEINHIMTYISMLEFRHMGNVESEVIIDDDCRSIPIPFLIIFTIVENSVKHALDMYEVLKISITCKKIYESDLDGCIITITDNGDGFPDEVLAENKKENNKVFDGKEHLGLGNVRYTLNLIYGRKNLLKLSNLETGGAKTEIFIPSKEMNYENFDM